MGGLNLTDLSEHATYQDMYTTWWAEQTYAFLSSAIGQCMSEISVEWVWNECGMNVEWMWNECGMNVEWVLIVGWVWDECGMSVEWVWYE